MLTTRKGEAGSQPDSHSADRAVHALADRYAAVIGPLLQPGSPFALLDFPDHPNIGDNAIYAGELVFLDAHMGRPPEYVCTHKAYRQDLDRFCPEGPILLHGGGNFGDIWPGHHALCLDVLKRHRGRPVIQLPQSIHFDDPARIDDTARAIAAHGRFTLLVRDEPSRDLAQRHFDCEVLLCPDGAYAMRRLQAKPGRVPVLSLLREDREAAGRDALQFLHGLGPVLDWGSHRWRAPLVGRLADRALAPRLPHSHALMRRREQVFRAQAVGMVARGVAILEPGRLIVSDRLHAHILSSLMRRPHVVLDNRYGKIARYIACWGNDGLARSVSGPNELRQALAEPALAG